MINDYQLFYCYKELGDILLVYIDKQAIPTHFLKKGEVSAIFHKDKLIGYNITNISSIVKIKNNGLVFFPNEVLIKIINNVLKNNDLELLAPLPAPLYFVGEVTGVERVKDGYYITINDGQENYYGFASQELPINSKIAFAKETAVLVNGDHFHAYTVNDLPVNAHILKENDLHMSNNPVVVILDDDVNIGDNLFKGE